MKRFFKFARRFHFIYSAWHFNSLFMSLLGLFVCVALLWPQEPIKKETLPDGIERWYRTTSGAKPRFFQVAENVLDIIFTNPKKLPFGKSVALLVGIDDYKYLSPDLPYVKNDIEDMRFFLLDKGGFDEVYVMFGTMVTRTLVETYVGKKFKQELAPMDRLLVYYAGHGGDAGGGTGYMQFAAARSNEFIGEQVMKIRDAEDWCNELKNKHVLVIFDCCASGLAFTPRAGGTENAYTQMIATLSRNGSRAILTAGTAEEKTFEVKSAGGRGNGVFTRAFLNALETGNADKGKDGFVTLDEAMAQVKTEVARFAAAYKQSLTPQLWTWDVEHYRGTFVFMNPQAQQDCKLPDDYLEPLAAMVTPRGQVVGAIGIIRLTSLLTGDVFLDDRKIDTIESGDVREYDVPVGDHTLAVRSGAQSQSQTLQVVKGETTSLTIRPESRLIETKSELPHAADHALKAPRFRNSCLTLAGADVKTMLAEFDFYCKEYDWSKDYSHPSGKGFANQFESKTIGGDKVVIDQAAGLMWQQGGSADYMDKKAADAWIESLNKKGFAGYKDWRLPTLEEAMSLMEPQQKNGDLYIDPAFDAKQRYIWTCDPVQGEPWFWVVSFFLGHCSDSHLGYYSLFVRAVRSRPSSG